MGQVLNGLFTAALSPEVFPGGYSPDLSGSNTYERRADGWATKQGLEPEWRDIVDPDQALEFEVGLDGRGHLFCGRAAEVYDGQLLVFENLVAGLTTRFLHVLGDLYATGAYLGSVDVGLAVTGLDGAVSGTLHQYLEHRHSSHPYDKDEYRRTERFAASTLRDDPRSAARRLVSPLTRATTRELYDPFS